MEQANKFFFLSAVNPHIVTDFSRFDAETLINFRHKDDHSGDGIEISVSRSSLGFFQVSYLIRISGQTITNARSHPIAAGLISGVIARIVNDAIAEEAQV